MQVSAQKWGNSASIRIPAAIMQDANLSLDQMVNVREEAGRIIIEPLETRASRLAKLVDAITDENLHAEISTGKPVGNEFW